MKNLSFLLLSIFFLISCGDSDQAPEKNASPLPETVEDPVDLNPAETPDSETFSLKAKFIEFYLGDAEHYKFEDESGKSWDFAGAEYEGFDFTQELDEEEADESNQGWGSNKALQGKWFELTYFKREQPQYMDGPMIMAEIISEAVLLEK